MTEAEAFDQIVARIRDIIPKWRPAAKDAARELMLGHRHLSACDRSVFEVVLRRLNWTSGVAFPGYEFLKTDTRFCRRSVIGSARRLRDAKLLLTDPRRGKDGRSSNHYTIPGLIGIDPAALVQMLALPLGKDTALCLVQPSAPPLVQRRAPEPLNGTIELEPASPRTDRSSNGVYTHTPIPAGWTFSQEDRSHTLDHYEISDAELHREREKFVAYHKSKATRLADWSGGWHLWITSKNFPYPLRPQIVSQTLGDDEWENALGFYKKRPDHWPLATYGPEPGTHGCRAPPELLRKHGLPATPTRIAERTQ